MDPHLGPLAGLRILDASSVVAGPLASTFLADLGAQVLKVEIPRTGDSLRGFPPHKDGVPLWWKVANRNKKGITLDLRKERGSEIFRKLLPHFDVVVENFRPGTLDGWGLSRERMLAANPRICILRVTGFGQDGPYRNRPGFARILEAMSGFTYICGEADRAPMHCGFPIADSIAGLFGAIGILAALFERAASPRKNGEEIDVSLAESMLRLLDFLAIEYDQLGIVRERSGNRSQYAAPGNMYRTADARWVTVAASTQSIFERLARAMSRADLVEDPRFRTNQDRVRNQEDLDAITRAWVGARTLTEVSRLLEHHEVAFSPIYSIEDVFADPHFREREAIISVGDKQLGTIQMQNVVPRFANSPGAVRNAAPALGEHNSEVYRELLGLSDGELEELRSAGVV